jgi:adenosine deaminase
VFVCRCLQDEEDFARIAYELCADEAAQGVRYAEVTFTPALHALRLEGRWDMPLGAVVEGFARGERDFGIRCRLVLDHARTLPVEMADQTLRAAIRHRDDGVVALGLAGDEAFAPELFARVFSEAVDAGLHSVPHAGEMAGPASIRGAIRALHAERIGHGIRILEDPDLVVEARHRGIALEVCPTSNVATGAVYSLAEHPLPRLLAAGLTVTLNSDDPAMFSSPLAGEYEIARHQFGMDDPALAAIALAGVRASFLDDDSKHKLEADIDAWLAAPGAGNGTPS